MDTNIRHRPAYFRGRPASQWIDALSRRRLSREHAPSDHPLPSRDRRS